MSVRPMSSKTFEPLSNGGGLTRANANAIQKALEHRDQLLTIVEEMYRTLTSPSRQLLYSTRKELEPWVPLITDTMLASQDQE